MQTIKHIVIAAFFGAYAAAASASPLALFVIAQDLPGYFSGVRAALNTANTSGEYYEARETETWQEQRQERAHQRYQIRRGEFGYEVVDMAQQRNKVEQF